MSEIVNCPHCEKKLRVPDDLLGKAVKCPTCQKNFTAGGAPAPPPPPPPPPPPSGGRSGERPAARRPRAEDEDFEERPKRRPAAEDDEDDDRPRRRPMRAAEEDEEDDRPRRRSRGRDEDEDFEDRPRSRSRSRDDEDDDRPRRRSRDEDDEDDRPRRRGGVNWEKVKSGLTFVLIGVLIVIVGFGLRLVISVFAAAMAGAEAAQAGGMRPGGMAPGAAPAAGAGAGALLLVIVTLGTHLASMGARNLGHFFCLDSPDKHGGKTLAVMTLIGNGGSDLLGLLAALAGLLTVGMAALAAPLGPSAGLALWLNVLSGLFGLVGWVCFLLYQRSVALNLRAYGHASGIVRYMITTVVTLFVFIVVGCIGGIVIMGAAFSSVNKARQNPGAAPDVSLLSGLGTAGMVFTCMAMIAVLVFAIWWVVILVQTRGIVAAKAARS